MEGMCLWFKLDPESHMSIWILIVYDSYLDIFNLVDSGQEAVDSVAEDVADGVAAVLVDDVTLAPVERDVLQFCHLKRDIFL